MRDSPWCTDVAAGAGCDPRRGTVSPHGGGQGPDRGWWAAFVLRVAAALYGGGQRGSGDRPSRHVVRAARHTRRAARPTEDLWPGSSPRCPRPVIGWVAVAGVDQPWLRRATVDEMVRLADAERAVVPVDDGNAQVTCAFYPVSWAEQAAGATRCGSPRPGSARPSPLATGRAVRVGAPGVRTAGRGSRWTRRQRSPRG